MPRFDQACTVCSWIGEVVAAPFEQPPCPHCGAATERSWQASAVVRGDDPFIGGLMLENLGHLPVTVYSRSELQREMRQRGLESCVRHMPVPGTDKSPHTTSWAAASPWMLEQARLLLERVSAEPPRPPSAPPPQAGDVARAAVARVARELP